MADERIHIQHYHTVTSGNTPLPENILDGEIALNISAGDEQIFLKNTDGEIMTFKPYETIEKIITDNELVVAEALINLNENKLSEENIKTFNGQSLVGSGDINLLTCGTF